MPLWPEQGRVLASYRNKPGVLQLAQDEMNCRAVVTTVMNHWVS